MDRWRDSVLFTATIDFILATGWLIVQIVGIVNGIRWLLISISSCNKELAIYLLTSGCIPFAITCIFITYILARKLDIPKHPPPAWRLELDKTYNNIYSNMYGASRLSIWQRPAAYYLFNSDFDDEHDDNTPTRMLLTRRKYRSHIDHYAATVANQPINCYTEAWTGPASSKYSHKSPSYKINGIYSQKPPNEPHPVLVAVKSGILITALLTIFLNIGWLVYGTILVSHSSKTICDKTLYLQAMITVIVNWTVPVVIIVISLLCVVCL